MNPIVLGILRHVVNAIGTILVVKGVTDAATVEMVAGAIATLGSLAWSIMEKRRLQPMPPPLPSPSYGEEA